MRIIIVEDEDSIRSALVRALQRDGHEVRDGQDLASAAQAVAGWTPDLVVSDLKLPDGDGVEFAARIGCRFIMVSGYATFDDAVRAMRGGAVDFFTKPIAIKDIRAAIARAAGMAPAPADGVVWTRAEDVWPLLVPVLHRLPGPRARLAAAEIAASCPAGRLSFDVRGGRTRLWIVAHAAPAPTPDQLPWLQANGIAVAALGEAFMLDANDEIEMAYDGSRELLQSDELVVGRVVQARSWVSTGSWLLTAVRAGAGPFAGLAPALQAAIAACGVSIRTVPDGLVRPGVGSAERHDLLDDTEESGPPLA